MKKLILISILVGLMATPVAGSTFRFTTQAEVLGFTVIPSYTNDADYLNFLTTPNPDLANYGTPFTYQVGIRAGDVGEITVDSWIGVGDSGFDLSTAGHTQYSVTLANDDDDWWQYKLFAFDTGTPATNKVSTNWETVGGQGTSKTLTLDISSLSSPSDTTLGIMIGIPLMDDGSGNLLRHEDTIHTSVLLSECQLEVTKEACVVVPGGDDCQGKVIRMELEYTGDGCSGSSHSQDLKKVKCSGDVDGAALVHIVVPGKAAKAKKGQPAPAPIYWGEAYGLSIGESVFVDAVYGGKTIIDNDTLVIITDPDTGNVEEVKFHTSCSQPLSVGDQFGSMKVISMTTTEGGQSGSGPGTCIKEIPATGADVEYTYTITNTGAIEITDVNVIDDGFEVPGSPIDSILPGNSVILKETVFLSDETMNTVVVTAAEGCWAEDTATITQALPEQECTTKVQAMLLEYIGPNVPGPVTVTIKAEKFKKAKIDPVIYDIPGGLLNGAILLSTAENDMTIDAFFAYGLSELGNKTEILINGVKEVIHTSCSTPFVIGEPAPLDKPKGDPSLNWLVVDFKQK